MFRMESSQINSEQNNNPHQTYQVSHCSISFFHQVIRLYKDMTLQEIIARFHQLIFHTAVKKEAQHQQTQRGTTELFFDTEANQIAFAAAIQSPKGAPAKILLNCFHKTNKACSFKLRITADPKKGARWILTASPNSVLPLLSQALNVEYMRIMKMGMGERAKMADKEAKAGSGSGSLDVGSQSVEP
jgi:hypothetical protein